MLWYAEIRDSYGGVGSGNCGFQIVEAETKEQAKEEMRKKEGEMAQDKFKKDLVISSGVKGPFPDMETLKANYKKDHPHAILD